MKKVLLLMNAQSGQGKGKELCYRVVEGLSLLGCMVTVFPILPKHKNLRTEELIKKLGKDFGLIVCAGGDGTLHYLMNAILKEKLDIPMGYIPCGSTNDFAHSLGIPKDLEENLRAMVEGERFSYDVGNLQGRFFNYIAAFGAFTKVSYGTDQELKNNLGHLAYLLESLRTLPENMSQSIPLKISAENFSEEGEYIFGAVSNSYSVAGFSGLPGQNLQEKMNIDLADGEFEVLLIRSPKNIGELGEIAGTLLRGDIPEDHPYVSFFKTRYLEFQGKKPVEWTLDGEFGGAYKTGNIEIHKKAAGIMLPKIKKE